MSWTEPYLQKIKQNHFRNQTYDMLLEINHSDRASAILDDLEKFVKSEGKTVSTSQVRNVYSVLIKARKPIDLQMFRPKLAYAAARQDKDFHKNLFAFIDDLIGRVNDKNIDSFKIIMEALVSYHKFYGKK